MPDIHAKLCSPSGAEGWFACAGRIVMEAGFPDNGNEFSKDGTARHAVCAECLNTGASVAAFVGKPIDVGGEFVTYKAEWVDEDEDYVTTMFALCGSGDDKGDLFVERQVNFERYTGVKDDSFGTADVLIFKPLPDGTHEMIVADRKTGYHEVEVQDNKQLKLYALGGYDEFNMVYDISRVRLVIHQRSAREWDCSIEDLLAFAEVAREKAVLVQEAVTRFEMVEQELWERTYLNQQPTEDACRYCKAMAVCPSMQRMVQETVGSTFTSLTGFDEDLTRHALKDREYLTPEQLADAMKATGLIEDWIKAVRAEVERRLLDGKDVPGFKLVMGKAGARKWNDTDEAEASLKSMRLKVEEKYDFTLISPTSAEKLAKAKTGEKPILGPRQWTKLQPLIGRSEPKPSVAPASDKRDAYVPAPVADDFQQIAEPELATDLA